MTFKNRNDLKPKNIRNKGFTIVELLVVIVIIGILAAITIVSYTGVTQKANEASIKSDLANSIKKLNMFYAEHGVYPQDLDANKCPTIPADTNYCLKANSGATLTYSSSSPWQDFSLTETKGTVSFVGTKDTSPVIANTTTYAKALGGSLGDYGNSLVQISGGGYVVAGTTASYGAGSDDVFVAKYDSNGNLIWNKTWGGTGSDNGTGIVQSSDGGYVISGYTNSYGAGGFDSLLLKFDSNGNLVWNKIWGGTLVDQATRIARTTDNGYVISGFTTSFGAGGYDILVLKYDVNGNLAWNKTWGGASSDLGYGITETNDGGCAIVGHAFGFGAGSNEVVVAKYDASGNLSWDKTWGGVQSDLGYSIVQTNDGGYAITGQTNTYGTAGDVFLIKLDNTGSLTWNKTWGGANADSGDYLSKTSDDGFAITGYVSFLGAGDYDLFINKYDSTGSLAWSKTWGGATSDRGSSVIQLSDNGFLTAGFTTNYGAGNTDLLLLKYNSNGQINNCSTPMCQAQTVTITTPSATMTDPAPTITTPSANTATPSATVTTPSSTATTIVAP